MDSDGQRRRDSRLPIPSQVLIFCSLLGQPTGVASGRRAPLVDATYYAFAPWPKSPKHYLTRVD